MANGQTQEKVVPTPKAAAAVTQDWTVGEVIKKYPAAIETMASFGLSCVGCNAQFHDTLKEGAAVHGMDAARVEEMVKEINLRIASNPVEAGELLSISKQAAEKVQELSKKEGKAGHGVHVSVTSGGCSGFSYAMDFQEKAGDNDVTVEMQGVKFFLDKESLPMLRGILIDYVDTLQGAGFKISNPNASSTCGCGQSFH